MMYILALLLPPVAVLLCGKPIQALINVLLTLCFWFPGALHACFVVASSQADARTKRIIKSNNALRREMRRNR